MSKDRMQTEWLLDNIMRLRSGEPAVGPYGALRVYRLHLITNTHVTAKGLTPSEPDRPSVSDPTRSATDQSRATPRGPGRRPPAA